MIVIFAGTFIAIAFAWHFNKKARIRREERSERMREKQEELLQRLHSGQNQDNESTTS